MIQENENRPVEFSVMLRGNSVTYVRLEPLYKQSSKNQLGSFISLDTD